MSSARPPPPPPTGVLDAAGAVATVLLLGASVWVSAISGDGDADRVAAEHAAAEEAEAADEAAAAGEADVAATAEAKERAAAVVAAAVGERAAGEAGGAATWTVVDVVDGDTIDVRGPDGREERVRLIGVDAPDRGECGFGPARSAMASLVRDREVQLVAGARDDRDRYDRILRYVNVDGVDAGHALIEEGRAISRYDSRDGYGRHDREAEYIASDHSLSVTCEAPGPGLVPSSGRPVDARVARRCSGRDDDRGHRRRVRRGGRVVRRSA